MQHDNMNMHTFLDWLHVFFLVQVQMLLQMYELGKADLYVLHKELFFRTFFKAKYVKN